MPYSDPHRLVTFFGDVFVGTETWQFGLRFAGDGFDGTGQGAYTPLLPTQLAEVLDAGGDFVSAAATAIDARVRYLGCKVAPQGVNGLYGENNDAQEALTASPVNGGSGAGGWPQLAIVVSTMTERSRGAASRGRFYLPMCGLEPTGNESRISAAQALGIANSAKTLITRLNLAGIGEAHVMSKTFGVSNPISGVRVGRVVDTMRSRRSSLDEDYQIVPFP